MGSITPKDNQSASFKMQGGRGTHPSTLLRVCALPRLCAVFPRQGDLIHDGDVTMKGTFIAQA
jgi:hypothetical protein